MTSMRHSFKLILEVTLFARPLHPPCIYKEVKLLRPAELPRRGSGKWSSLRETEILAKCLEEAQTYKAIWKGHSMARVPKSWLGEVREERKDIHTDTPTMELA